MKKILIAVASMALVAGCGGGGADEMLGKLRSHKDKICACKDKACVENAEKEMMEWLMKNAEKYKDVKPTKAQDEAADKIQDEMEKCKDKLEGGGEAAPQ
ncbi:MAG: hypothetical protein F9K40_19675 [Kofleriaceae bacterium]|nr:MAG: hypothetical protein F9K40_19675 [Kofleriaceae bacterium]MBZ0237783.1 hypothetical protein [Kofleriaceae bacterium]